MSGFWTSNIDRKGRAVRAAWGVIGVLTGIGVAAWFSLWPGLIVIGFGFFALFEAFRGWCVVRACGIKTRW